MKINVELESFVTKDVSIKFFSPEPPQVKKVLHAKTV